MNYPILLSLLNLILLARLRLISRDDGATQRDFLIMCAFPLLALLFLELNLGWVLLLIYFSACFPLIKMAEKSPQNLHRNRGLVLIMHIVVLGVICSPLLNLNANALPDYLISFADDVIVTGGDFSMRSAANAQVFIFGFLMVINEMNIVLRYLLQLIGLKPLADGDGELDEGEYNTGRLIGLLERIFVFLFVLLNQYTAIGFILAAKGVARFQDFKSRTFAEYVLIGTLLSTLLAVAIGYFVKLVI